MLWTIILIVLREENLERDDLYYELMQVLLVEVACRLSCDTVTAGAGSYCCCAVVC